MELLYFDKVQRLFPGSRRLPMTRRKGKPVSFDAMVKFFMQQYGILTRKDLEKLMERMDRLEKLINNAVSPGRYARNVGVGPGRGRSGGGETSASDIVLDIIARSGEPVGVPEIREKTGFGDKKLRNIIFRLYKNGDIVRKQRGRYVAS